MENSLETDKMNRSIKMVQKGFTLIELMIVVAIIGILAALAIPAYQDYVARSQASEALTITDGLKVTLQEYYADSGVCPINTNATSAAEAGIDLNTNLDGSYVAQVDVEQSASDGICIMTATYRVAGTARKLKSDADDTVPLTMVVAGDMTAGSEVDWVCDNSLTPAGEDGTLVVDNPEVAATACRP